MKPLRIIVGIPVCMIVWLAIFLYMIAQMPFVLVYLVTKDCLERKNE